MALFKKKNKTKNSATQAMTLGDVAHLNTIRPNENYWFRSDYFEIDDQVACIMNFFHREAAQDSFRSFWGVNMIPSGLPDGVSVMRFEQIRKMTDSWVQSKQKLAEKVERLGAEEAGKGGYQSLGVSKRKSEDLWVISTELINGASYLHVQYRLLIKAPDITTLEEAIDTIDRLYVDRFGTLEVAPYFGRQREELENLFAKNDKKHGHGFYYTSTEFAGSYSLVTHGLEDPAGEYIGAMTGDVNNSAVLFDVDNYKTHVVIASESRARLYDTRVDFKRERSSAMWASKMSQSALISGHKVVHLLLDGTNLDNLGPAFKGLTYKINMNSSDINMFEMFGETERELSIFPMHMQKLILMAEQAYETTEADRSIIRGKLEDIATQFYIDSRMWYENAQANRDRIRIVNIPHEEVPKLELFVAYLDQEYKKILNMEKQDQEMLHAVSVLKVTFQNMLTSNGDLFNCTTTSVVDDAKKAVRVIYDFNDLLNRGVGIAMAQFVNIINFAADNLGEGDTLFIHGVETIDNNVKDYVTAVFERLLDKGGRVVFCYNKIDKMLKDKDFNTFDKADYTILGCMTENVLKDYQIASASVIPADLSAQITQKSDIIYYIRRDFDNVVFNADMDLCLQD